MVDQQSNRVAAAQEFGRFQQCEDQLTDLRDAIGEPYLDLTGVELSEKLAHLASSTTETLDGIIARRDRR